jgi:hypothetical protein
MACINVAKYLLIYVVLGKPSIDDAEVEQHMIWARSLEAAYDLDTQRSKV